jgi:UbiA prenyltransferase family
MYHYSTHLLREPKEEIMGLADRLDHLGPLSIMSAFSHAPCLRCCKAGAWSRGSQGGRRHDRGLSMHEVHWAMAPLHVAERVKGWAVGLWVEMRPQQWVKNCFVLTPLLFSRNLFAPTSVGRACASFILFCLVSSSVYLLNDMQDRAHDRLHPTKRLRPLAAGALNLEVARGATVTFLLLALAGGVLLHKALALVLLSYWLINLLYSTWLKEQVILDVFTLASGFVLRVVGGGIAIAVEISYWLLLCTTLLAQRTELGWWAGGGAAFVSHLSRATALGTDTYHHISALVDVRRYRRLWKGCCRYSCIAAEPPPPRSRLRSPCVCRCAGSCAAGDLCAHAGPLSRATRAHRACTGREARPH